MYRNFAWDVRGQAIREWRRGINERVKTLKSQVTEEQEKAGVVTRGLLKIHDGHVYYGWAPLLIQRGDEAHVGSDIRAQLKTGTQSIFDEILFELRQKGTKIRYHENLHHAFSSETQIKEFQGYSAEQAVKFNQDNDLGLTEEEMAADSAFKQSCREYETAKKAFTKAEAAYREATDKHNTIMNTIKEKISVRFGIPSLPGGPKLGNVNLTGFAGSKADAVRWLTEPGSEASYDLQRFCERDPRHFNLLRVHASGKSLQTMTGYTIPLAQARRIFDRVRQYNRREEKASRTFDSGQHHVVIHSDHLEVGCQRLPMSEVTRFGAMQSWDVETPKVSEKVASATQDTVAENA